MIFERIGDNKGYNDPRLLNASCLISDKLHMGTHFLWSNLRIVRKKQHVRHVGIYDQNVPFAYADKIEQLPVRFPQPKGNLGEASQL